ncbi:MAG: hypothetical protein ABJE66_25395 [Deltaproteobacteria bacterium]
MQRVLLVVLTACGSILFAHCDDHGLWLPREGRAAFDELGGWEKLLAVRR